MSVKSRIRLVCAAVSVIFTASGCGCVTVQQYSSPMDTGINYYNGESITGVPVSSDSIKPAESIPLQTGTHTSYTNSSASKKPESLSETETTVPQTDVSTTTEHTNASSLTVQTTPQVTTEQSSSSVSISSNSNNKPAPLPSDNLPVNNYSALNYKDVKGVWISYFELYPILTGKSKSQFASGIGAYYDNCLSLGINTVFVHVRPYGDAMYKSDYFPWSKYCTGYIGENPGFDPLEVMISEAHSRGISFHAWINPLRCYQQDDAPLVSDGYLTKQWYNNNDGDYIVKVNSYWWLNPAYKEVTDLIALGVAEIVSKYDVDGIHIDDYFYPTTDSSFDSIAFNKSSYNDLSQFRLDNCSRMVAGMYNAVKTHNPTALFGVSAQGNVNNNETQLFADVVRWSKEDGFVDYMAPQIYYGFENSGQPFSDVVEQWDEMLKGTGRPLIPGLAVYKIGNEDTWAGSGSQEWIIDKEIIRRQIEKSRTASNYGGVILYSYQFIFEPESSLEHAVNDEIAAFKPLLIQ